ncbi:MAG: leucine--tRNA ligase [Candidatus Pacebacteria bacterium]|nr:leucine--tRNA ligase [Candidatus Paceibacterota bacterium]
MSYNPQKIEAKWQKFWKTKKLYSVKDLEKGRKNFYHLVMFPYPSGDLHIGHWYNFAPADVYARFKRLQGFNVMSPMGFDAFGLPAEQAAIKRKIHPEKWTLNNIKTMVNQFEAMGNIYDWSRMIITCLPEYYKWNQWIFLKLFEKGLAYRKKAPANWCDNCKSILANEQAEGGKCWRCEGPVEQKEIDQWLLRITDYADRLLEDLDSLDWPERTKIMQKNWIGRSEGAEIEFPISNSNLKIKIFTTRADTVPGVTYLVVAPEHSLIKTLEARIRNINSVREYLDRARRKSELERMTESKSKSGVELQGITAINPFTKKEVPVWVSDYVLAGYGTGAIMAVPAHDERDFEFAKKFGLQIIQVVSDDGKSNELKEAYTGDGAMVNSKDLDNLPNNIAKDRIIEMINGKKKINYRFHDWLISRQRYWGTPIPIIYCKKCGAVPVPEKDLPVLLPKISDYTPEAGKSPLARSEKFVKTKCPKCGDPAERETDTMDTFVDSSWYYIRYTDPKNSKSLADIKKVKEWLPVKMYIGGAEHAVMHLLYARFFTKFLYDEGLINFQEPFLSLRHQGIILGTDGQKMSKSRGNVVDPDELVSKFGADSVRLYLCFMGEYHLGGPWNPTGILGVHRFLNRAYQFVGKFSKPVSKTSKNKEAVEHLLHKTIKKVGDDIELQKFNTAISALMVLLNEMEKNPENCTKEMAESFLKLLAPFAPHLTEELWNNLGNKKSIYLESWPEYSKKYIIDEKVELIIQINGRLRDKLLVARGMQQLEIEEMVMKSEKIKQALNNAKPKKIIFVADKLINLVV